MSIHINPGSGPVPAATVENASANAEAFAVDLRSAGIDVTDVTRAEAEDYGDGRFAYRLTTGDERTIEVQMPGLPLEQVRYVNAPDQDIWDFPRLYVDDSSWVWMFALRACQPDDEDDDAKV